MRFTLAVLNGFGEFFLKMLHEIEDSILRDATRSASGLVEWIGILRRSVSPSM